MAPGGGDELWAMPAMPAAAAGSPGFGDDFNRVLGLDSGADGLSTGFDAEPKSFFSYGGNDDAQRFIAAHHDRWGTGGPAAAAASPGAAHPSLTELSPIPVEKSPGGFGASFVDSMGVPTLGVGGMGVPQLTPQPYSTPAPAPTPAWREQESVPQPAIPSPARVAPPAQVPEPAPVPAPAQAVPVAAPTAEQAAPPVAAVLLPAPAVSAAPAAAPASAGVATAPVPAAVAASAVPSAEADVPPAAMSAPANHTAAGVGTDADRLRCIERGREMLQRWRTTRVQPAEFLDIPPVASPAAAPAVSAEEVDTLRASVAHAEQCSAQAEQRAMMAEAQVETLRTELTAAARAAAEARAAAAAAAPPVPAAPAVDPVVAQLRAAQDAAERWEVMYQELADSRADADREASTVRADATAQVKAEYEFQLSELRAQLSVAEQASGDGEHELRGQLAAAGDAVEAADARARGLDMALQEAQEKVQALSQEAERAKALAHEASTAQGRIAELEHALNAAQAQHQQAAAAAAALERQLQEVEKQRAHNAHLDPQAMADEVRALNAENERMALRLREREQSGSNVDVLVNERNELKQKVMQLQAGETTARVHQLEMQVVKLTSELADRQDVDASIDKSNHLAAENERLRSLIAQQGGAPNPHAAHEMRLKEQEWGQERERHRAYQERLEAEAEEQRARIADLEDAYEKAKAQAATATVTEGTAVTTPLITEAEVLPANGSISAAPVQPPPPGDYYVSVTQGKDPVTGEVIATSAYHPLPAGAPPSSLDPPQLARGTLTAKKSLPLSVVLFETIWSLGGILPSTRHKPLPTVGEVCV
eukprot:TRINITY_DN1783_c0_g1_i1.p1 TRINITY_DN1783_c0_g1~~TRINITY_DN1783_c0_g1_i1.p1  ORF type:complete len:825 (+),score=178.69 TRINITY_DN1783_c0_g1_i1:2-2476(+)